MTNETTKQNRSNVIAWIRWGVDVIIWLAQNWDEIPKPPSRFNQQPEQTKSDESDTK